MGKGNKARVASGPLAGTAVYIVMSPTKSAGADLRLGFEDRRSHEWSCKHIKLDALNVNCYVPSRWRCPISS